MVVAVLVADRLEGAMQVAKVVKLTWLLHWL